MRGAARLGWHRPAPGPRSVLTALLLCAAVASVLAVGSGDGLLHGGGAAAASSLLRSLASADLSPAFLLLVLEATATTAAYACAGMSVAVAIGLVGAVLVSGSHTDSRVLRWLSIVASRGVFGLLRGMHELVWALLLVTVLGLTPLAGILAIGIPYGAAIARVVGERLQDVPAEPVAGLRQAGGSAAQVLVYARVPPAAADSLAYILYRLECAVRAAAVLSFVGLGGIGYRIQVALADLRFDQVWTLLAAMVLLVVLVDRLSVGLRGRYAA